MNKIYTCRFCNGKGNLKVRRRGFKKRYFVKCHDCKATTIKTFTPEKAILEWNSGWIFGGTHTLHYEPIQQEV